MDIRELEPKQVWKHFLTICSIPHPSHEERALGEALMAWAKAKGIETAMDAVGNVVMRKPASPGKEDAPGVILQAHLDMVPQKAGGSAHVFSRDPIRPRVDPASPAWIVATGTTLGADDGIGIAMAMAALEDDALIHGPLECLFTVNEEDGMSGARVIGADFLSGSLLLNIDGEDDGELTIGCAGSIRSLTELTYPSEAAPSGLTWLTASVGGLLGGHSGVDIDKGRANATLALAGLLERTRVSLFIAGISGGTASNAIPREASAVVGVATDRLEAFKASFSAEATKERIALGDKDPGFVASIVESSARPERALPPKGAASMLTVLGALPNGLIAMEPDMPGLIRTSLNLGTLAGAAADGLFRLEVLVMIRSSSGSEMEALGATVEKRLSGAVDHGWSVSQRRPSESPAWSPDTASPLLATTKAVYKKLFGKDPKVSSTHGGLETGLFRPRFPDWDMISLGPNIRAPHSPDERVEIASVQRSYRFLRELVQALAVPAAH